MSAAAVITGLSTLLTDALTAEALSASHETAFRDVLDMAIEVYPASESDFTAIADAIPAPSVVDAAAVEAKLKSSIAHHNVYRAVTKTGGIPAGLVEIRAALSDRQDAEALDPLFTAPYWAVEVAHGIHHAELILFYESYIARYGS